MSYPEFVHDFLKSNWYKSPRPGLAYSTDFGSAYQYKIEEFLVSKDFDKYRGKVELLITSPPFPLVSPKRYGNKVGDDYLEWLAELASPLSELLTPTGSIVLEIGNAWVKGEPTMSTLPLETLITFGRRGGLHVNQQFVCHNPSRLPSPAVWVNIKRIRVKDSFTHVWWFSKAAATKADNRKVLKPYSAAMEKLLERGTYNTGKRPSDHSIGETSFLTNNGGAIPSSMLSFGNTNVPAAYRNWCKEVGVRLHPARMQEGLVQFFVDFLTDESDLVFDPFGGSATTGSVAERSRRKWAITEPDFEYLVGSYGRFI